MAQNKEILQVSPERRMITMISFIAAIILAAILLFAVLAPIFMHKPETQEPQVTKVNYKKPDQGDYKKIIENSKTEYDSFMQQNKNR